MKTWPQYLANFMLNDLRGMANKRNLKITDIPPQIISFFIKASYEEIITRNQLRNAIDEILGVLENTPKEIRNKINQELAKEMEKSVLGDAL